MRIITVNHKVNMLEHVIIFHISIIIINNNYYLYNIFYTMCTCLSSFTNYLIIQSMALNYLKIFITKYSCYSLFRLWWVLYRPREGKTSVWFIKTCIKQIMAHYSSLLPRSHRQSGIAILVLLYFIWNT